jgi:SNF2 family DNA or RNA helicase
VPTVLDRAAPDRVAAAASRIQTSSDVTLPGMPHFRSSPCEYHADMSNPAEGCQYCGIKLRKYQRVAAAWLLFTKKALLADEMGLGKTISTAALLALLLNAGELNVRNGGGRVLIVCRPAVLSQWQNELRRALPALVTEIADGTRAARSDCYARPWDALLIGHQMLLRDKTAIQHLGIRHLIIDDVDAIRNAETLTSLTIKTIARQCNRVVILTGTPLQKRLIELYDLYSIIGGEAVFGSKRAFKARYLLEEPITAGMSSRGGSHTTVTRYYKNLPNFKERIKPMTLRRTIEDIDDLEMPAIVPDNIYLDLYPAQRERYNELIRGVVRLLRGNREQIKRATAITKILYGSHICEGLVTLGEEDDPGTSVKLDWFMDKITTDWAADEGGAKPEKVVVFMQFKAGVRALHHRLEAAGIGHALIWGENRGRVKRAYQVDRFWRDSDCQVLIGTSAIEQSLNLQVSRRLVDFDQLMNPARMRQLAGRVRRLGSQHRTVYIYNLLASNTHEERILRLLQSEAALAAYVWEETDPLYAPMTPEQLLRSIAPTG